MDWDDIYTGKVVVDRNWGYDVANETILALRTEKAALQRDYDKLTAWVASEESNNCPCAGQCRYDCHYDKDICREEIKLWARAQS